MAIDITAQGSFTINQGATEYTGSSFLIFPDIYTDAPTARISSYTVTPSIGIPVTQTFPASTLVKELKQSIQVVPGLGVADGTSISVSVSVTTESSHPSISPITKVFTGPSITKNSTSGFTGFSKTTRRRRKVGYLNGGQKELAENLIVPTPRVLEDDGAFLRIDKSRGPYWAKTVGGLDVNYRYRLYYTHGYTMGGYKSGTAYNTVYKTLHNSDTVNFVGYNMHYAVAYTGGSWGDRYAYTYRVSTASLGSVPANTVSPSFATGTAFYSSNLTQKFDMATESSLITNGTEFFNAIFTMNNTYNSCSVGVVNNFGLFGYLVGVSSSGGYATEEHDLTTDTFVVMSGSNAQSNGANCATGKDGGYFHKGGVQLFNFATKTSSLAGSNSGDGHCSSSCAATKLFKHYHPVNGLSADMDQYDEITDTSSLKSGFKTISMFEESYQTGEQRGFTVGTYGQASGSTKQDNAIFRIVYDTDSMSYLGDIQGAVTAGISTSCNVSASGAYLASILNNYSLVQFKTL